jgi:hypothetical protein
VHRRIDIAIVGGLHGYLGALIDVEGGPWDRSVVGEHPELGVTDPLLHGTDTKIEMLAILQTDVPWARGFG